MSRRARLDAVVADARAEVRAQIAAGGRVRDFAAMIARAQELDPAAISEATRAEAANFASVVALGRRPVEADAPAQAPASTRRSATYGRRLGWAAALLLLGGGLVGAVEVARRELRPTPGAAVQHLGPAPAERAALPGVEPRPTRAVNRVMSEETSSERVEAEALEENALAAPAAAEPVDDPQIGTAAPRESGDAAPADTETRPSPGPARRAAAAKAPEPAVEAPWAALDRSARAAWRRGDREAARALFAAIVASDAEASRIELAFGDLMVLARLSGEHAELKRLRRAYLRRFPRGLYADDAQAGLCRDDAPTCWRAYLARWPQGAHAEEARRALAEDE